MMQCFTGSLPGAGICIRYISSLRRTKYSDIWFNPDLDDDQRELVGLKVVQQEVTEPFILAHLRHEKVVNALKLLTSKSIRDSIYRAYVTTVKNANYRKEAEQIYTNATTFTDNGMAPDFIYEDVNGKMVSLRDLRGNTFISMYGRPGAHPARRRFHTWRKWSRLSMERTSRS